MKALGFRPLLLVSSTVLVLLLLLVSSPIRLVEGQQASSYYGSNHNNNNNYNDVTLNVYGEPLHSCSYGYMAMAGTSNTGYCVDDNDENDGSHYYTNPSICINMTSLMMNDDDDTFCTYMGQDDGGCSTTNLPCHADPSIETCDVENACVDPYAFAKYILPNAGGCSHIPNVYCDAIPMDTIVAYQEEYVQYRQALHCLVDQCSLNAEQIFQYQTVHPSIYKAYAGWALFGILIGMGIGYGMARLVSRILLRVRRRQRRQEDTHNHTSPVSRQALLAEELKHAALCECATNASDSSTLTGGSIHSVTLVESHKPSSTTTLRIPSPTPTV